LQLYPVDEGKAWRVQVEFRYKDFNAPLGTYWSDVLDDKLGILRDTDRPCYVHRPLVEFTDSLLEVFEGADGEAFRQFLDEERDKKRKELKRKRIVWYLTPELLDEFVSKNVKATTFELEAEPMPTKKEDEKELRLHLADLVLDVEKQQEEKDEAQHEFDAADVDWRQKQKLADEAKAVREEKLRARDAKSEILVKTKAELARVKELLRR
jgi:hypothetical protein